MMGNRMPQKIRTRKSARAALCAVFGIALVVASGTVAFAGDDGDDDPWDAKMVKKFLRGFGLRNGQEAGIEYKERPPLVLPPSRDLPPPVAADAIAVNNPAWPSDPDEKRRAEERKAKKVRKSYDWVASGEALKPDELAAGKSDKPSAQTGERPVSPEMTPSQLGYMGGMWSSLTGLGKSFSGEKDVETRQFVREPSRQVLTDPPQGYRTPSPTQPYGINSKTDKPKASAADRQTETVGK